MKLTLTAALFLGAIDAQMFLGEEEDQTLYE
jgi:hypothetical protein